MPRPETATTSAKRSGAKRTPTDCAAPSVTSHGPDPEHAPLQRTNRWPAPGSASSETLLPASHSVVHEAAWCPLGALDAVALPAFAEVAYKPGVTDNEAESVAIGAARLGIGGLRAVKTLRRYPLAPGAASDAAVAGLYNPLIQTVLVVPTPAAVTGSRSPATSAAGRRSMRR